MARSDFIYGDGHRWYTNPKACPHYNESVCETCDFDGYYASRYASCPWRGEEDDLLKVVPTRLVTSEDLMAYERERPWETTLSEDETHDS